MHRILVCIIGLFIYGFSLGEVTDTYSADQGQGKPRPSSCHEFLERTQSGLVTSLRTKISDFKRTLDCLNIGGSGCERKVQGVLNELNEYHDFRVRTFAENIRYNLSEKNFNVIENLNGNLRNEIRRTMPPLRSSQTNEVWKRFEAYQKEFLQNWIPTNFERADQCFSVEGDSFRLTRIPRRRIFLPTLKENIDRQDRNFCKQSWSRMMKVPFAVEMARQFREDEKKSYQENSGHTEPWVHFLDGSPEGKSLSEKKKLASRGLIKLIAELRKLLSKIENMDASTRFELLNFDGVVEDLGDEDFCEGERKKSWGEWAKEAGLMFIPGLLFFENLFIDGPLNDRAFVAGFIDKSSWRETNTEINRESIAAAALALPQAALEGAVVGKVMARVGPRVSRYFSKLQRDESSIFNRLTSFVTVPVRRIRDLDTPIVNERLEGVEKALFESRALRRRRLKGGDVSSAYILDFGEGVKGVFKPCIESAQSIAGCTEEVLAYQVDKKLGMGMVPPTIMRKVSINGVPQRGSVQLFEENAKIPAAFITIPSNYRSQKDMQSFFDFLVDNGDRHDTNNLLESLTGRMISVDHGATFRGTGINRRPLSLRLEEIARFAKSAKAQEVLVNLRAMNNSETREWFVGYLGREDADKMMNRIEKGIELLSANADAP